MRFIRNDDRYANTRVIIATSEPTATASEVEISADLVLLKPINFIQLRELAKRFHYPVQ